MDKPFFKKNGVIHYFAGLFRQYISSNKERPKEMQFIFWVSCLPSVAIFQVVPSTRGFVLAIIWILVTVILIVRMSDHIARHSSSPRQ